MPRGDIPFLLSLEFSITYISLNQWDSDYLKSCLSSNIHHAHNEQVANKFI